MSKKKLTLVICVLILVGVFWLFYNNQKTYENSALEEAYTNNSEPLQLDKTFTMNDFQEINLLENYPEAYQINDIASIGGALGYVVRNSGFDNYVLIYDGLEVYSSDKRIDILDEVQDSLVYKVGSSELIFDDRSYPFEGSIHDVAVFEGKLFLRTSQATYFDGGVVANDDALLYIGVDSDGEMCRQEKVSIIESELYCGDRQLGGEFFIPASYGSMGTRYPLLDGQPLYVGVDFGALSSPFNAQNAYELYGSFNSPDHDWFILYKEAPAGKKYNRITDLQVADRSYGHIAFRGTKSFVVFNGEEFGKNYDGVGGFKIEDGHVIYVGVYLDNRDDVIQRDVVVGDQVVLSLLDEDEEQTSPDRVRLIDSTPATVVEGYGAGSKYLQYGSSKLFEGEAWLQIFELNGKLAVQTPDSFYIER